MTEPEYRDLSPLGFPGYRVGNDGSPWSFLSGAWLPLAPYKGPHGRPTVKPKGASGDYRDQSLAVLVLRAFLGERPSPGSVPWHADGDPWNCAVANLSWVSRAVATSRRRPAAPRCHGGIVGDITRIIRERREALGITRREAAARIGAANAWWQNLEWQPAPGMRVATLLRVAVALECEPQDLLSADWRERIQPPMKRRRKAK